MGNVGSDSSGAASRAVGSTLGSALPRELYQLILRQPVLSLRDFYACMRVCRVWRDMCLTDDVWRIQLQRFCLEQWPDRTSWTGYQLVPVYFGPEWTALRAEATEKRSAEFSWRDVFATKRIVRVRFDLFTGYGSLLHHHFIEGFFRKGSLVLGTIYDMLFEPPRIVYSGFFRKGRRQGPLGISYHPEGSMCYMGPWEHDEPHGQGKSFWKNGHVQYVGSFFMGKRQGLGTQYFSTGTYEGEWSNDAPHGRGCWVWKDGTRYVGCMQAGKRDGFGILLYANGSVQYEGNWKNDLVNGYSKKFRAKGNNLLQYEGNFVDGLPDGKGKMFHKSTGKVSYDGEFVMGKRHGFGVAYRKDGEKLYEGFWKDGLFDGDGTLYNDDGTQQTGAWRKGAFGTGAGAGMDDSLMDLSVSMHIARSDDEEEEEDEDERHEDKEKEQIRKK